MHCSNSACVKMGLVFVWLCLLAIVTQAFPVTKNTGSDDSESEFIHERIYKINKENDLNLFEGDLMIGSPSEKKPESSLKKRNAVWDRKKLWINKVVPYEFSYGFPANHQKVVLEAIQEYHHKTCIRFKPRTSEKQWIVFVYKSGCWSSVGRSYWLDGVGQEVSLGLGCDNLGTALHEIMHALGFWHEQSRPDRNQYVEVLWENIEKGEDYNFNKYPHGVIDTLEIPYDFKSIMHYGTHSFSKNGKPTIRAIRTPERELGQRVGFTDLDIQELNALYDCKEAGYPWSKWSDFGPCSLGDCKKYSQRFCTSDKPSKDCPEANYYGVHLNETKCSHAECYAPIDGHWGRWSSWGSCSKSCGYGQQKRTRDCNDPKPQYNGKTCVGSNIDHQRCHEKTCGLGPDDCEFDHDKLCHWKPDDGNYKWARLSGATPSGATGPTGDHSSNTGHYMYTEGSAPAKEGDKARLRSREFVAASEGRCLSFWYHMYGEGIRSLSVIVKDARGERQIWKDIGNKGNKWNLGHVTVVSPLSHQVIFEAERGTNFRSDIALDDVKFEDGPCVEEVGCYGDNRNNRTLPDLYANLRSKINWFDMRKTVKGCAILAAKKHYKFYGVQFYGECWGGPAKIDFSTQKSNPEKCWSGVGGNHANFVYKII